MNEYTNCASFYHIDLSYLETNMSMLQIKADWKFFIINTKAVLFLLYDLFRF